MDMLECPNLEVLICNGFSVKSTSQLASWILNSQNTLKQLDVSRTCLKEHDIKSILSSCTKLELCVATEVMKRYEESSFTQEFPNTRFIFDLLSHQINPIKSKKSFIKCLYNVDGEGCSLIADAIYVGTDVQVLGQIIDEFNIDVNKYNIHPDPWEIPYPMKHKTNKNRMVVPLHQASLLGFIHIMEYLITQKQADVNLQAPPSNRTALAQVLLRETDPETGNKVISTLISHGARIDLVDDEGLTPLDIAVSRKLSLTIWIMANSKHISFEELNALLFASISISDSQLFSNCIHKGADPLSKNKNGDSIVIAAIRENKMDAVKTFLSQLDESTIIQLLKMEDSRGWKPLHHLLVESPFSFFAEFLELTEGYLFSFSNDHRMFGSIQSFCHRMLVSEDKKRLVSHYFRV